MLMKDFLQNVVRTPDLLRLGYQVVLDKLKHENYRRQTLELLVEGSFEYVTVLTQNVYQQLWAELQQSEQQQTRLSVVQAVARNHTNRKYL
jgi:predicted kinase